MKLEEIRKLIDAATPGPWVRHTRLCGGYSYQVLNATGGILLETTSYGGMSEDAALIAASRTLLPKLLAVAEAAQSVCEPSLWVEGEISTRLRKRLTYALAALEADGA